MFSPQKFAKECGLSYNQVLQMCKTKEINALETEGGHFKIPPKELDKFKNSDHVSKDEYLKVIRENERLRTVIEQFKNYVLNLKIG
ncbi:DNA-binding protein [Clostridium brassicae]|uniref:DNA-binding protein n=1 Tax=Clostridium brassicae TaxID=2999072 RepID=A0ABT4DCG1_9CLOT|nr:DNA-binding protein [Clostridium brassicae]MCY6958831.1 DNA-binding protein [Clostridium brassicae]